MTEIETSMRDYLRERDSLRYLFFGGKGGVGKTALVNKWLLGMAKDNYRGAERVYGDRERQRRIDAACRAADPRVRAPGQRRARAAHSTAARARSRRTETP